MPLYLQPYNYDKSTNLIELVGKPQAVGSHSNQLASAAYDASGNQLEIANKKVSD